MLKNLNTNERKVLIVGLLSLFVAVVTYGLLASQGKFENKAWNLGGAIVGFLASAVVLNRVYGTKNIDSAASINNSAQGSKSIELIDGSVEIINSMVLTVQNAERYIYAIGGRSRNETYLNAIKDRVAKGGIRYVRIITGDHILHHLCKHLHDLFESSEIGYLPKDKYGNVIVTDRITVIALPSPSVKLLDKGLKIIDERVASDYREYIIELLGKSNRNTDLSFIESLCSECNTNSS